MVQVKQIGIEQWAAYKGGALAGKFKTKEEAENMQYTRLPQKKTKNHTYYDLLARSEHAAIYEQRLTPDGPIIGFEVFKIIICPEHAWQSGITTPSHEKFPSNEDFGFIAWSYNKKETALAHFNGINERIEKAIAANIIDIDSDYSEHAKDLTEFEIEHEREA